MILSILFLVIAFAGFGSLMYFSGLYTTWYWYFIPILGMPISYVLLYGLTLVILFPFSKMVNIDNNDNKRSKLAAFIVRQVNHLTIVLSLTRVKYLGFKNIDQKKEYMIIYNHISNFDPMVIMNKMKRLICITKYGNKKIPVVGGMIHKAGYITINRENDMEGIKAINRAIEVLNNHEASICVSPEGTRSKTLELLPFHPGTFNIAKRSGAPIVCVAVTNTNMIHKNFPKKITKVKCEVIHILRNDEYSDMTTSEIAHKLHTIYKEYLGG